MLAQVAADAERWDVAAAYLTAVPESDDPQVGVLTARLAHARGRPEQAREMAKAALATAQDREQWSVACQALEVVGRAARIDDADAARDAFAAAERLAAEHDLPLDRVSALHELGTVDLLVDGSTSRLERARSLAVDAGLLGLAATLDVQIAAGLLHRDVDRALIYAVRSADLARRLRADRLWATAVYFQAVVHVTPRGGRGGRALRPGGARARPGRPRRQRRDLGRGPGARGAARRRPGAARAVPGPRDRLPAA